MYLIYSHLPASSTTVAPNRKKNASVLYDWVLSYLINIPWCFIFVLNVKCYMKSATYVISL